MVDVTSIDHLLPQTQCTKCGYDDCLAYANAIAGGTPHNQCPPGGKNTIEQLSEHLGRPVFPLNPKNGVEQPTRVAVIDEALCIGCMKCLDACPVDAIMGANKMMHSVIQADCTGCDLCVEPCPMDCIQMKPLPERNQPSMLGKEIKQAQQNKYRQRHQAKKARLLRDMERKMDGYKKASTLTHESRDVEKKAKQHYIKQALLRVKQKQQQRNKSYDATT